MKQTDNDTIPTIEPQGPGLPPARAKVEAETVAFSVSDKDAPANLRIRILRILEYGPSTPPIAADDTLAIRTGKSSTKFTKGTILTVTLQHNIAEQASAGTTPWALVEINQ